MLAKEVQETFQRTGAVWLLTVNGQTIRTTGEHPFCVEGQGWTAARELRVGDRLIGLAESGLVVEKIEDADTHEVVYNLRIADWHTYFVGTQDWGWALWAHNTYSFSVEQAGGTKEEKDFRQSLQNRNVDHDQAMKSAEAQDFDAFKSILRGRLGFQHVTYPEAIEQWQTAREIVKKKQGFQDHHLLTNKNDDSKAEGGPYTQRFLDLATKRGWDSLDHPDNIVSLQGHQGPHARYNRLMWEAMSIATQGKDGEEYNQAYDDTLNVLRLKTITKGTRLNNLSTGQGDL